MSRIYINAQDGGEAARAADPIWHREIAHLGYIAISIVANSASKFQCQAMP